MRTFIYRLVLYMFISLIVSSLINLTYVSYIVKPKVNISTTDFISYTAYALQHSSLALAFMLMSCITVCIYLMALHNYQYTFKSDICLLISSILYLTTVLILTGFLQAGNIDLLIPTVIVVTLPLPVNIVFTALTLVPLCCRACGYNLCMKTAATIESHRKALREILPFFIFIVPSFLYIFLYLFWLVDETNYDNPVFALYSGIPELISPLSFALHLFFIRKKLKKLRSKKRTINQHTHRTTVFTSYGISETCNTEYLPVSENEEDTRFLTRKSNLRQ